MTGVLSLEAMVRLNGDMSVLGGVVVCLERHFDA